MERRVAFALLKRLLPPFMRVESRDLEYVSPSSLRLSKVAVTFGGQGRGALRGVSVELLSARITCDNAEFLLDLCGSFAGAPSSSQTHTLQSAADSVTASAVSSLLAWLLELCSSSALRVTEFFVLVRVTDGLSCCFRGRGLEVHAAAAAQDGGVGVELSLAAVEAWDVSAQATDSVRAAVDSDADEVLLQSVQVVAGFAPLVSVASASVVMTSSSVLSMPVIVVHATIENCAIELTLASLTRLKAATTSSSHGNQRHPFARALQSPQTSSTLADVRAPVKPQPGAFETPAAAVTPVAPIDLTPGALGAETTLSSPVAAPTIDPLETYVDAGSEGFFSAVRDVLRAVWSGSASVRETLSSAGVTSSAASGVFERLGLAEATVDDDGFEPRHDSTDDGGFETPSTAASDFLYQSMISSSHRGLGGAVGYEKSVAEQGAVFSASGSATRLQLVGSVKKVEAILLSSDAVSRSSATAQEHSSNTSVRAVLFDCRGSWSPGAPSGPLAALEWSDFVVQLNPAASNACPLLSSDALTCSVKQATIKANHQSDGSLAVDIDVLSAACRLALAPLARWAAEAVRMYLQLESAISAATVASTPVPAVSLKGGIVSQYSLIVATCDVILACDYCADGRGCELSECRAGTTESVLLLSPLGVEIALRLGGISGRSGDTASSNSNTAIHAVAFQSSSLSVGMERMSATFRGTSFSTSTPLGTAIPLLTLVPPSALEGRSTAAGSPFFQAPTCLCILGDMRIHLHWSVCTLALEAWPVVASECARIADTTAALFPPEEDLPHAAHITVADVNEESSRAPIVVLLHSCQVQLALASNTFSGFQGVQVTCGTLRLDFCSNGFCARVSTVDVGLRKVGSDASLLLAASVSSQSGGDDNPLGPARGADTCGDAVWGALFWIGTAPRIGTKGVSSSCACQWAELAVSRISVSRMLDVAESAALLLSSLPNTTNAMRHATQLRAAADIKPLLLHISVDFVSVAQADEETCPLAAADAAMTCIPSISASGLSASATVPAAGRFELDWGAEVRLARVDLGVSTRPRLPIAPQSLGPPRTVAGLSEVLGVMAFTSTMPERALSRSVFVVSAFRAFTSGRLHISEVFALGNTIVKYQHRYKTAMLPFASQTLPLASNDSDNSSSSSDAALPVTSAISAAASRPSPPPSRSNPSLESGSKTEGRCMGDVVVVDASQGEGAGLLDLPVLVAYRSAVSHTWGAEHCSRVDTMLEGHAVRTLFPSPGGHSSEEWLPGCVPADASPFGAGSLIIAELRQLDISLPSAMLAHVVDPLDVFTDDDVASRFEGLHLVSSGVHCVCSKFAMNPAVCIERTGGLLGWALEGRLCMSVEDLCLTESLSGHASTPQASNFGGGGTSVLLLAKSPEGLQQPSLRCSVHLVRPVCAGMTAGAQEGVAETRVWCDMASHDLCMRGRTLLFLDHATRVVEEFSARYRDMSAAREDYLIMPDSAASLPSGFYQLVAIGDLQLLVSFLPEAGMADVSWRSSWIRSGDAEAAVVTTFPLLEVDRLSLRLHSVTALHAVNASAAAQQLAIAYIAQFQQEDGVHQVFTNVPAAVLPRASAVLQWMTTLACAVFSAAGGQLADAGGRATLGASMGRAVSYLISTGAPAAATAGAAAAQAGMRFMKPSVASVLASIYSGGRAIMSAFSSRQWTQSNTNGVPENDVAKAATCAIPDLKPASGPPPAESDSAFPEHETQASSPELLTRSEPLSLPVAAPAFLRDPQVRGVPAGPAGGEGTERKAAPADSEMFEWQEFS